MIFSHQVPNIPLIFFHNSPWPGFLLSTIHIAHFDKSVPIAQCTNNLSFFQKMMEYESKQEDQCMLSNEGVIDSCN